MNISKGSIPHVTERQWQRLNDLLTEGAVVELPWLQSAAGLRKDSAVAVMNALARSGGCEVAFLIFHDCAEHNVAVGGLIVWPWRCPECESLVHGTMGEVGSVWFEQRLTLTKPVRFV